MPVTTRRPVAELPEDPDLLYLEFRLSELEQMDGLWTWWVSVRRRISRHVIPSRERPPLGKEVGRFTFVRLLDDDRRAALNAAEAEDTGLYNIVLPYTSWTGGGVEADLRDQVTRPSPDLLVMWEARLDPAWRGFGLGPVLAAEAIDTLATGCCAVLADTTPQRPAAPATRTEEEFQRGRAALAATWQQVGFRRDGSHSLGLLDPAGQEFRDSLTRLRAHQTELSRAYAARDRP